jgi:hypothetical protein
VVSFQKPPEGLRVSHWAVDSGTLGLEHRDLLPHNESRFVVHDAQHSLARVDHDDVALLPRGEGVQMHLIHASAFIEYADDALAVVAHIPRGAMPLIVRQIVIRLRGHSNTNLCESNRSLQLS